jgi:hypothetical protein
VEGLGEEVKRVRDRVRDRVRVRVTSDEWKGWEKR